MSSLDHQSAKMSEPKLEKWLVLVSREVRLDEVKPSEEVSSLACSHVRGLSTRVSTAGDCAFGGELV